MNVFAGEGAINSFLKCGCLQGRKPLGALPQLQPSRASAHSETFDDGRYLAGTVAIWEYLEEKYSAPPLIGAILEERVETRQWQRRLELNITEISIMHITVQKDWRASGRVFQ